MKNVKDIICQNSKFIDVFFNRNPPENIRDFFVGARPINETYEDKIVSFTEYTPSGATYKKVTISADNQRRIATQHRCDYIEYFKSNKHADVELVEAIVLSESEKIAINSHFHVGELLGDYAEVRIKSFGNNEYNCYQGTIEVMDEIVSKVQNGEILRVWYGHNARDLCGLMSLLKKLNNVDCTIIELELPDKIYLPNNRVKKKCRYWHQIQPK